MRRDESYRRPTGLVIASPNFASSIAGAGLDVWVDGPPPVTHRLLGFDNVIATYHTAGITVDSRENMRNWNAQQIAGIFCGERPPRLINSEAWPRFSQRFEPIFGFRPTG